MIRALVTRPREDAERTVAALAARGVAAMVEPLLVIEPLAPAGGVDVAGAQALLFTSANGVRAFAAASDERRLPALAVGDATAEAARAAGFSHVESAAGDAAALAELAAARSDPAAGPLLHLSGEQVAGDLAGRLAASGLRVRRMALYRARAADALSPACREALAAGRLDIALFFSPRTAAVFARLAAEAGVADACRRIRACVPSRQAAGRLRGVVWGEIRIARRPNLEAMMAEVEPIVQELGRPAIRRDGSTGARP